MKKITHRPVLIDLLSPTVDPKPVLDLLHYKMATADSPLVTLAPDLIKACRHNDEVDYLFRQYLLHYPRQRHPLYQAIQRFLAADTLAPVLIADTITLMGIAFLLNEWYELMPRFKLIQGRIHKRFSLPASHYQTLDDLARKRPSIDQPLPPAPFHKGYRPKRLK